jgi:hypothetical protein
MDFADLVKRPVPDILTINVTANDIAKAERAKRDCWQCPIAKAAYRRFKGCFMLAVYLDVIHVIWYRRDDTHSIYGLPPKAVQFVDAFDHGENVSPIRFETRYIRDDARDMF